MWNPSCRKWNFKTPKQGTECGAGLCSRRPTPGGPLYVLLLRIQMIIALESRSRDDWSSLSLSLSLQFDSDTGRCWRGSARANSQVPARTANSMAPRWAREHPRLSTMQSFTRKLLTRPACFSCTNTGIPPKRYADVIIRIAVGAVMPASVTFVLCPAREEFHYRRDMCK